MLVSIADILRCFHPYTLCGEGWADAGLAQLCRAYFCIQDTQLYRQCQLYRQITSCTSTGWTDRGPVVPAPVGQTEHQLYRQHPLDRQTVHQLYRQCHLYRQRTSCTGSTSYTESAPVVQTAPVIQTVHQLYRQHQLDRQSTSYTDSATIVQTDS